MITVEWATTEDYQELLAVANQVFDHLEPVGFQREVPKIYNQRPDYASQHLVIRQAGKIVGLTLCHQQTLTVGGMTLRFGGIGTVTVLPQARGQGYMGKMLRAAEEYLRREGFAFCELRGQRQRYENYGYISAGPCIKARLTQDNLRHHSNNRPDVTLVSMEQGSPYCEPAHVLYRQQSMVVDRKKEEFIDCLRNWQATALAVTRQNKFAGYLSYKVQEDTLLVQEILLEEWSDALAVGRQLLALHPETTRVQFYPLPLYHREFALAMADICEDFEFLESGLYAIYDIPAVLQAFLQMKADIQPVSEGSLEAVLDGTPVRITLRQQKATVEKIQEAFPGAPSLTYKETVQALFSLKGYLSNPLGAPEDWFPLPITLLSGDVC